MKLLFVKFPFGTEMRMSQQNHEGGWSGIGMATVGIHPNDFDLYPNKIPPGRVVQNCQFIQAKFCLGTKMVTFMGSLKSINDQC